MLWAGCAGLSPVNRARWIYKATLWAESWPASCRTWVTLIRARQRGEQRFMHKVRAPVGIMGGANVGAKQKEVSV